MAALVVEAVAARLRRLRGLPAADVEDIEGAVQLSVLQIMRTAPDTPTSNLRMWLYHRARAMTKEYFRLRRKVEATNVVLDGQCCTAMPSPEHALVRAELRRLLEDSIRRLPKRQQDAVRIREEKQSSVLAAAMLGGANPSTIRVLIYRAAKKLRAMMIRHGYQP